jgi:iron complex outermembrane receptor protein
MKIIKISSNVILIQNPMKRRIFKMLTVLFLGILVNGELYAQGIRITGKVTDEADGSALIGVTVQEKGTTNGTLTDVKGSFIMTVSSNATLIISYIGYKSLEIPVNNQTSFNIAMAVEEKRLQEVVVIGYGTTTRKDATGSVAAVVSRDFNKGSVSSPQSLIVGKVPGVSVISNGGDPTAGATIRIRGGSSMSASNDPLIIIDGVAIDNSGVSGMPNALNLLNSNDIESFTVLKDASATAIYGSRASNGVILITTKKGLLNKPMKVTYDGSISFGTRTGQIDVLNTQEFIKEVLSKYPDGTAAAKLLKTNSTNWQNQVYQTAVSHDHNISLTGSYKILPYRASIGYTNQTGLLKTSGLERFTGSLNLNPSFLDNHLTVTVNSKYMHINNRFANWGAVGSAMAFDPTKPVYDETSPYGGYWAWRQTSGAPITIATTNPVAQLFMRNDRSGVDRLLGNAQIEYRAHFLPELKATLNLGGDFSKSTGHIDVPENASWSYDAVNGGGQKQYYDQHKRNELLDFYLNYKKELTSIKSRVDATAGYSWQHFYRNDSTYSANAAETRIFSNDPRHATENYLVSFFGRLNYVFADRYLVTATLRADGSSRFAEGNKWGYFPSVALAWDIKGEPMLRNVSALSQLKLRLGYGITGQQEIGSNDYPYLARYTFGQTSAQYQFGNQFITTLRPEGYDKNLKWEETTTYNIGLDFGFAKDRITGTLDFYKRPTKDLLNTIPVPAGTNLTNQILTNVGDLVNKGIEFSLNIRAVQSTNVDWSVGLNATYNENKITRLTAVDNPNYIGVVTGGIAGGVGNYMQIHTVGYPVSSFYMYEQVYNANKKPVEGLYVDRNSDGNFTDQDKYRVGKPAADLLMGLSSSLRVWNWDFSLNGRVSLGNLVYNNMSSNYGSYSELYRSVGVLANLNRSILDTRFANPQYWSDYYLEDGSFFKMDNISLGHTFKSVFSETSSLRVYSSVQNVFTITRYTGLDPEVSGGIDSNLYPRPRTFLFGVSMEF